jgi:hypothetical protein
LRAQRRGVSALDFLAFLFLTTVPLIPATMVTAHYGIECGFWAGYLANLACWVVIIALSAWGSIGADKRLRVLSEKYPSIYRIQETPPDTSRFLMAEGAMMEIGDYGWEAEPLHDDGLIYLQGLTEKWGVVWYAGFRTDQIEKVGRKPRTQYFLPVSWYVLGPDAFPCPFPVQARVTADMGMPAEAQWSRKPDVLRS